VNSGRRNALFAFSVVLLAGCNPPASRRVGDAPDAGGAADANAVAQSTSTQRAIVKFDPSVDHPESPEFIAGLSKTAGVAVRYVNAIGAGVHVLALDVAGDAQRDAALAAIAARPDVVFAEPDSRRRGM